MKFVLFLLAALGVAGCASVQQVSIYELDPGAKSDGLSYSYFSNHYLSSGGSIFYMTPDGSVFQKNRHIGNNPKLWRHIEGLVEKYGGKEVSDSIYAGKTYFFQKASFSQQEDVGPMCMDHWEDRHLVVRVGQKNAFLRSGQCDSDSRSDRAGREIRKVFVEYIRGLDIEGHNIR